MRVDVAVASKAQAMFGRRLRFSDYQELSRKDSVAEIAAYLKNQTYYRDILEGVNEHSIHRGYLELLLRQNYFYRFGKLLRYSHESKEFIQFGIMNVEYQLLMSTIYMVNDEDRSSQIAQLPLRLNPYTSFDMEGLVEVWCIDDLINLVKDTIYYDALKEFKGVSNADLDIPACEYALRNVYTRYIIELISKQFKGETEKELHEIFDTQLELNNIAKIYRLKKYYQMDANDIKDNVILVSAKITEHEMMRWIEELDAEGIVNELKNSPYRSLIKDKEFIYVENYLGWIAYQSNIRHMRFSESPEVIITCYMSLLQSEISNLVNIIEGVRYHVAAEKVMQLLVY